MKNIVISISILLLGGQLTAQVPRGIWISKYLKEVEKVQVIPFTEMDESEIVKEVKETTSKKNEFVVDTSYSEINGLLHFLSDDTLAFINPNKGIAKFRYKTRENKIKIRTDELKIRGYYDSKSVVLLAKENKNKAEIHFERIKPSKLDSSLYLDSTYFFNTNWDVITTVGENYKIKFHFLDSNSVVITRIFGEYGYTIQGETYFSQYSGHVQLEVYDGKFANSYVYHFYNNLKDTIYGDSYKTNWLPYKSSFLDKPPERCQFKFIKNEILKKSVIKSMESKIEGTWEAINDPIPTDSIFGSTLINQNFEFTFQNDKTFRLVQSGELISSDSIHTPKTKTIFGNWHLSETGTYIKLNPKNEWTRYITLIDLTNSSMTILYEVRSLDGGLTSNRKIQFKKTGPNN